MNKPVHALALNVGSSSLKFGLYEVVAEQPRLLLEGTAGTGEEHWLAAAVPGHSPERQALSPQRPLLTALLAAIADAGLPSPQVLGHRIVHGGPRLTEHRLIDEEVLALLKAARAFAPLHLPPALKLIEQAREQLPHLANVACLDTCFHAGLPELSRVLPLPRQLRHEGVRRYGFHGLSCESILDQLADPPARLVIAHLGSGASVTAVREGRSIDTSMGLTPSGGVIMASRPGDLDPGILLYLQRVHGYDAGELEELLDRHAGLTGISGISGDLRILHQRAGDDPDAALALAQFAQSVAKQIAGMVVALGGIDRLVLTGGIGEHDQPTREDILRRLHPLLGNLTTQVLPARENHVIARYAARLLPRRRSPP